jgi:hypothetical protein
MDWLLQFNGMSLWARVTLIFVIVNLVGHVVLIGFAVFLGFFELKEMLAGIASSRVDETDDGRVKENE